ncbi:hypothetical protein BFP77_02370 [Maribacter sp. 4U21]|uniref:hypothetical protein n=1 Tax=Maribacter sp. 4U21 TaxID=1889779 RepID=UPI000C14E0B4|nr:hypothetical protein [Maribacter sp. 4U21]PIB31196.1 hypothetical protein BFP77_02370 [Maribacter sp. 4U21]
MILSNKRIFELLICSIILFSSSCSKDVDLLSDYVIADNNDLQSIALLADDTYFMSNPHSSVLLDVLTNDSFGADSQVSIVATSEPRNGTVIINEDNTLTYTLNTNNTVSPQTQSEPETTPEQEAPEEDSFEYTTEVINDNGETFRDEATVTISPLEMGELKAFPGAEGFGKNTTGGRGGAIIHVTNLNDSGPGSFRDAVERKGTRTVIFDVGGEIKLLSDIKIRRGHENLTIAGETAPSPGISFRNYGIDVYCSNVIMRYITIRLGGLQMNSGGTESDCLRIINWGPTNLPIENIIVDHCSFSWATDENISFRSNADNADIRNITFSNLIVGEPSSESSYNMLAGTRVFEITLFNNFFSTSKERSPLIGYGDNGESLEIINNVVYGFESGSVITYGSNVDFIGNIYKGLGNNNPDFEVVGAGNNGSSNTINEGRLFATDNFKINAANKNMFNSNGQTRINNSLNRYFTNSYISNWAKSITEIENQLLSSKVGNSIYRDAVDSRLINNYFNDNGFYFQGINPDVLPGGWPNKTLNKRPSTYDTDLDGMSDDWERDTHGDLSKNANGDENGDGFTNIEEFFHWLTLQN